MGKSRFVELSIWFLKEYGVIIFVLVVFLALTCRFWGEVPALDQLVIYRESTIFFKEGLAGLVKTGFPIHPPLIYELYGVAFVLFGKSVSAINVLGALLFVSVAVVYRNVLRSIFNEKVAAIATILLFSTPLVVLNAFYVSNDFLILVTLIFAMAAFVSKKWISLGLVLALMVLLKETALVYVGAFWLATSASLFFEKGASKTHRILNFVTTVLPSIIAIVLWRWVLTHYHATEWRESFFVSNGASSFQTVLDTLLRGQIFSKFWVGNMYNAFIMNYQYVFTVISTCGILGWLISRSKTSTLLQKQFILLNIGISFFYIFLVLTFPTWTLARYAIPLYVLLFLGVSLFLNNFGKFSKLGAIVLFCVNIVANVSSSDLLSIHHLQPLTVQNIDFYSANYGYNGYTMVDYNMQYLEALKRQNTDLKQFFASDNNAYVGDCIELKTGEKIMTMQLNAEFYPRYSMKIPRTCVNWWEQK